MLAILFILTLIHYSSSYEAVKYLDLNKYIGTWFQVYGDKFNEIFQGNGICSKAYYKFNENNITVHNTQLDKDKNKDSISGFAYYKDNNTGGYLTVHLNGTPEAPYWVIELGPVIDELYDYAIVSDDKRLSLYVLTRNVTRFYSDYDDDVLYSLDTFGFSKKYNSPITMDQSNC